MVPQGHAEVHELQRGVTTGSHTARSGVLCDAKIRAVGGVHQMLGGDWMIQGMRIQISRILHRRLEILKDPKAQCGMMHLCEYTFDDHLGNLCAVRKFHMALGWKAP